MSYPNAYLRDFVPVLGQILKEKQIAPEKLHLEIIDEESEEKSIFEPVGVDEVLDQLADELNHLTVYTDRPAHFQAFAEQIYEENGLMPLIFTKKQLKSRSFSGAQGVADRADMRPGVGDIVLERLGVILTGVPAAAPILGDTEAESGRADFLTHGPYASSRGATTMVMWHVRLLMRDAEPLARGRMRFRVGPSST